MSQPRLICLVTIHGIGFQQAPGDPDLNDGYADNLHTSLLDEFPDGELANDPNRLAHDVKGAVYVQSCWPPKSNQTEAGISRLGSWSPNGGIDMASALKTAPLRPDGSNARFAHVALVYSHLEGTQGDPNALLGIGVLGAPSLTHYATIGSLIRLGLSDVKVIHDRKMTATATPSQQVRDDVHQHRGWVSKVLHTHSDAAPPTGPLATLREVEDDVASYVVNNGHRERVRAFVLDAVSRIIARDDVEGVVINGHSNGTVMGFDLIAALSPPSAAKVLAFVTAGCPLRKYVDFMDWGTDARNLSLMSGEWTNFYDDIDPVADPLGPTMDWKRGRDDLPADGGPGMFVCYEPGCEGPTSRPVKDILVDNSNTPGGLPSHNYWDNAAQFVRPLAGILRDVATSQPVELVGGASQPAAVEPVAAPST